MDYPQTQATLGTRHRQNTLKNTGLSTSTREGISVPISCWTPVVLPSQIS
jgi:hypothetical protein